jgi:hypothetical protein
MTRLMLEHDGTRRRQFERLKTYLTDEQPRVSYQETAAVLGLSENAVKQAVYRLKQQFNTLVREEVGNTVASAADIKGELQHLLSAVSADAPLA